MAYLSVVFNGGFVTKVGQQINYREAYGVFVATSAIISCDLYVMINEYMWDWVFMLIVGISILLVFFWTGIYTCFQASAGFYRAAPEVYGAVSFWAYLLMAPIVCLLPRWTAKSYQKLFLPRDIDIIREQWMIFHRFDDILGKEDDDDQEKGDWDSKGMDFEKNRPANRDDIGEDQMIEMEQDHRNELDSTSSTNGKGRGSEGNIFIQNMMQRTRRSLTINRRHSTSILNNSITQRLQQLLVLDYRSFLLIVAVITVNQEMKMVVPDHNS